MDGRGPQVDLVRWGQTAAVLPVTLWAECMAPGRVGWGLHRVPGKATNTRPRYPNDATNVMNAIDERQTGFRRASSKPAASLDPAAQAPVWASAVAYPHGI
jgi:hypothetical protein